LSELNWACADASCDLSCASCDAEPPWRASCKAASALWRLATAVARFARAVVGSSVASTCPALTWSPTATLTAVTVPPVVKFSLASVAGLMLPEAVTLSWTMPRCTVTVLAMPVDAEVVP
jgi:hypothetical protein